MRAWVLTAAFLSLNAAAPKQENATLLETAVRNGRTWVCVETSDRILIGQRRGSPQRLQRSNGRAVLVRHDDAHLWVGGTKFRQDYLTRAFASGSRCEQIVDAAIARRDSTGPKELKTR